MFRKFLRKEEGFTMVEMMVVLIIVAVLIAGGIKFYLGYIENSRVTKAKAQISTMQASLDAYYAENGAYPKDTDNAKLKVKLLNAGLVDKELPDDDPQVAGQDCLLNVADPWNSYYRYHSADGVQYYIRTGKYTVQGQTETAVYGSGNAGSSSQPTVGKPS